MNFELTRNILFWLTGLWAFGLGLRFTLELYFYSETLVVGILWFDWIPLMILGLLTLTVSLIDILKYLGYIWCD